MHLNFFNYKYLIVCVLSITFFSCSSTRKLQKRESAEVYQKLGIEKNAGDNYALYKEISEWLNVPHKEGGLSMKGIDCSGLVDVVYKQVYGKTLERNSADILKKNCHKIHKSRLDEGDLVFFKTTQKNSAPVNHVGIYLKDQKFVHTSTARGVIISNLDDDYYRKTWVCGGKVVRSE